MLEDQGIMTNIQELVDTLRSEYQTESVIVDLRDRKIQQVLLYRSCGVRHTPSLEQKRKIQSQFEILSLPSHIVKADNSRGALHGQSQWQYDHWKAKDTKRNAQNIGHDSILLRWKDDEKYRNYQIVHGVKI